MKSINFKKFKSVLSETKYKITLYNKNNYNLRPGDSLIILALFGGCGSFIILLKNFFLDIMKSTPVEYNLYSWTRIKGFYRIEREPFVFQPQQSEYRDLEKYNKYMEDKSPENSYVYSKISEDLFITYLPKHSREIVCVC
jgi:hypothetical protein